MLLRVLMVFVNAMLCYRLRYMDLFKLYPFEGGIPNYEYQTSARQRIR